MSSSLQVRMTRTAISPRFATKTFLILRIEPPVAVVVVVPAELALLAMGTPYITARHGPVTPDCFPRVSCPRSHDQTPPSHGDAKDMREKRREFPGVALR